MTEVTIVVPDISCDTCKNAIEGPLRPLPGVRAADVEVTARRVRVSYDEAVITRAALDAAIEERGYEVGGGD
jgi:copper chaperone CopZ